MGEAKRRKQFDPSYGKVRRGWGSNRAGVIERSRPFVLTAERQSALKERREWDAEMSDGVGAMWYITFDCEGLVDHLNYPVFCLLRLDAGGAPAAVGYIAGACAGDAEACPDGLSFMWVSLQYSRFMALWEPAMRAILADYILKNSLPAAQYSARYQS